jgi:hypothetical protein
MQFYETLVRADFILAVALLVVIPLVLLAASIREPEVRDRLLVYWRASALLGITVYLWAGEEPMGFATGFAARALIPLALWRGDALTVLRGRPNPPSDTTTARLFDQWRTAAIAYNVIGLVYMLPLLPCVFSDPTAVCQVWYEPPAEFTALLHPSTDPLWLARYGWVALGLYAAYLLSTAMRLQRDLFER